MKKLIVGMLMLVMGTGIAIAGVQPSGQCPDFVPPENCIGGFTKDDMGSFVGGVWVWNQAFLDSELEGQGTYLAWMNNAGVDFTPIIFSVPVTVINVKVDRRKHANFENDHTRLYFKVSGQSDVTYIPEIWLECMDAVPNGDGTYSYYQGPCNPDNYQVQGMFGNFGEGAINFKEGSRIEQPAPTVVSTVWKGMEGTPYINERHEYIYMLKYDTGKRDWYHNYYDEYGPMLHYKFFDEVSVGVETFTIYLSDGSEYTANVTITNVDEMPLVPAKTYATSVVATKVNKKGKIIKASEVEVETENILIKEVDDPTGQKALVIQWDEPDGALFGNTYRAFPDIFMLRVYVGKVGAAPANKEIYLWIDCPVQTGTVVVGSEHYNWLKDKLVEEGLGTNDIVTFIMYRTVTNNTNGELDNPHYHNRGISDFVQFTPVP